MSKCYCEEDGEGACSELVLLRLRFQIASEAVAAYGNTERAIEWFRKWQGREPPTKVQYSLSLFLMEKARELIETAKAEA